MKVLFQEEEIRDHKTRFVTRELKDMVGTLPIGMLHSGKLLKNYGVKSEFKGKQERTIGKWKNQHPNGTTGKLTSFVVSYMLDSLGPHANFGQLGKGEQAVILQQMHFVDVLVAYFGIRLSTLDKAYRVQVKCPACRKPVRVTLDLGTMEVTVAENWEDCLIPVSLPNGIPLTVGDKVELFKDVVLAPPKWHPMEAARDRDSEFDLTINALPSCLHEVAGLQPEQWMGQNWLDDIDKLDLEQMVGVVEEEFPQADLLLDLHCVKCGNQWAMPLDWSYDNFFGSASLRSMPRTKGTKGRG